MARLPASPPVGAAPLFTLPAMQTLARDALEKRVKAIGSTVWVAQAIDTRPSEVTRWRKGARQVPLRVFAYLGIAASFHDTSPVAEKPITHQEIAEKFWAIESNVERLLDMKADGKSYREIALLLSTPECPFTLDAIKAKLKRMRTKSGGRIRVERARPGRKAKETPFRTYGGMDPVKEAGHPISWGCINTALQTDLGAFQHFDPVITSLRECAECNADTDGRSYCWDCHARFYQPKVAPTKQYESAVYFALRSSPAYGA